MKIKAKIYGYHEVMIIDFVSAHTHDIKAVYVDESGKVDSCYIEHVEIMDKDYIPAEY